MSLEAKPLPEAFRVRVKSVRTNLQARGNYWVKQGGWTYRLGATLAAARAKEQTLPPLDLGPKERDCAGNIIVAPTYDSSSHLTPWPAP